MFSYLQEIFSNEWVVVFSIATLALFVAYIAFFIFKNYIFPLFIKRFAEKTRSKWDDKLVEAGFFGKVALIIPITILYYFVQFFPQNTQEAIIRILSFLLIVSIVMAIDKFLNAVLDIYSGYEISHERPMKGYVQLVKIAMYILAGVVGVCALLGISPIGPLSGIGAMTAVLMLVFKDTILSVVASVQIVANNIFKVGDWIEISSFGADGTVIDIALHSVKVQNFDKTIISIPTYKFLDISVKNWRGMERSGARRIKRNILIDLSSIHFASKEEIEKYKTIDILKDYMQSKDEVISNLDKANINSRRLTNIGTYRAYIGEYLKNNEHVIKNGFTFLVRQLEQTPKGLPIQIYVFASDNRWAIYEGIQSDIFDHLLSSAQDFNLRLFQDPTGSFSS